jgi:hypothetical protein
VRLALDTRYLVGPAGAQIEWPDGTRSEFPAHAVIRFERRPRHIVGTLYPLRKYKPTFETPE